MNEKGFLQYLLLSREVDWTNLIVVIVKKKKKKT